MGLDITAYSKITFIKDLTDDHDEDGLYFTGNHANFASRFSGKKGLYGYDARFSFHAGGYIGYSHWRESLAKFAGYAPKKDPNYPHVPYACGACAAPGGPFWELIYFTDCDGTLGPEVCAKLHRDFEEARGRVEAFALKLSTLDAERFVRVYNAFATAFQLASDGGAVDFH